MSQTNGTTVEFPIDVAGLTFSYPNSPTVLRDLNLKIPAGACSLLIGSNGAGKSTFLRILAGKHMHVPDTVKVLGKSAFHNTSLEGPRAYIGNSWARTIAFAGHGVAFQADIAAGEMDKDMQERFPERAAVLVELLDLDLNWRMNRVSDGQRRRVQIFLGLLNPFQVLLLDEVTVDLDVVVRQDLLRFLKKECETRGATVLYATHIFDGLADWATHLAHLDNGTLVRFDPLSKVMSEFPDQTTLLRIVESWLRAEREAKKKMGKESAQVQVLPSKFYNYWG